MPRENTPSDDEESGTNFGDGADWDPHDPAAPDAVGWPAGIGPDDDVFLAGGDATPVPGEYATAATADPDTSELRELARRVDAQRPPAFPIDLRRHLPMQGLWERSVSYTHLTL